MKASPDAVEERRREIFFSLVRPHIDKVDHLARHMIRFYETTGELVREELDPAESSIPLWPELTTSFFEGAHRKTSQTG